MIEIPLTGDIVLDVLVFLCIGWVGSILLLPISQWIDYKWDCKKHGKKTADMIRKRWR